MAWSEDQRRLAGERMAAINRRRWGKKSVSVVEGQAAFAAQAPQALIEPVTHVEGRASVPWTPEGRVKRTDYLLRMSEGGQMVSMNTPCVCGKPRGYWHAQCFILKGESHAS
jgi:hypothetical protein